MYAVEYTVGVRPAASMLAELLGRLLAQHEDRRLDAGPPQVDTLLGERDAQAGGAGTQRLGGDRRRAVAVAVGLHDRPDGGRGDDVADQADVVVERVEVDLRPRPTAAVHAPPIG